MNPPNKLDKAYNLFHDKTLDPKSPKVIPWEVTNNMGSNFPVSIFPVGPLENPSINPFINPSINPPDQHNIIFPGSRNPPQPVSHEQLIPEDLRFAANRGNLIRTKANFIGDGIKCNFCDKQNMNVYVHSQSTNLCLPCVEFILSDRPNWMTV